MTLSCDTMFELLPLPCKTQGIALFLSPHSYALLTLFLTGVTSLHDCPPDLCKLNRSQS